MVFTAPAGFIALVKQLTVAQLTLPSTANPYLLYSSAGGGLAMPAFTFGGVGFVPYAFVSPVWWAMEPGDYLTFVNDDTADWQIAGHGALLEM